MRPFKKADALILEIEESCTSEEMQAASAKAMKCRLEEGTVGTMRKQKKLHVFGTVNGEFLTGKGRECVKKVDCM